MALKATDSRCQHPRNYYISARFQSPSNTFQYLHLFQLTQLGHSSYEWEIHSNLKSQNFISYPADISHHLLFWSAHPHPHPHPHHPYRFSWRHNIPLLPSSLANIYGHSVCFWMKPIIPWACQTELPPLSSHRSGSSDRRAPTHQVRRTLQCRAIRRSLRVICWTCWLSEFWFTAYLGSVVSRPRAVTTTDDRQFPITKSKDCEG